MKKEESIDNLISIVIPVYNAAPFLARTLQSIELQTYQQWELILVDDASTDESMTVARHWMESFLPENQRTEKIRFFFNETNLGAAKTRNRGIKEARGRYLVYLDADDYWDVEKLEKQIQFMRQKQCAFSFTGYEFANQSGVRNGKVVHAPKEINYREAIRNTTISTITVMFDRSRIPEELLYMPEECQREDTATWWRILKQGYTAYGLDEALSVYCRHKGSHSSNKLKAVAGTYQMYRRQEHFHVVKTLYYMTLYIFGAIKRRLPHKLLRNG